MGSWHRMLHLRQMHAAGRRGMDSWTRLDTTSCQSPGYVIFQRILPMEPDMDHLCGSACITKHMKLLKRAQRKQHKTVLDRWNRDDKYRKSLSDVGWAEESLIQYDEIAFEDHSYIATRQERSRNEKSGKLPLNAEGIQGPLNQRSGLKQAKQTCKILYQEHTAITGSGNKPIPPEQSKPDKGAINSLNALRHTIIDSKLLQDGDTILLPQRIHLRHHDDNQAATCGQRGTGLVEIFILDWTVYFFKNCSSDVTSLARNLISWQSTVV